ncbi:MAG: hypothetical protein ABWY45_05275 [Mycobacterium sp.]
MAFKLTYTDGQEAEYDDDTAWEVDDGVLKLGRSEGNWSVLVSPSHWAVIEVGTAASRAEDDEKSRGDEKSEDDNADEDSDDADSDDDSDDKKKKKEDD